MINVEDIKKLLECAILTGYVKDDISVSIFMIAKPETGKSELIKTMRDYPNTYYTNELSFKGCIDYILPEVENNRVTHILIPDFINIISHRRASETLIPLLGSLMAEGVKDLKFFGSKKEYPKPIYAGLITGITKEEFDKRIIYWRNIGFLTRTIVITFAYSESTRIKIHEFIRKGNGILREMISKDFSEYRQKSLVVEIPEEIALNIEMLAITLTNNNSFYVLNTRDDSGYMKNFQLNLKNYGFRLHNLLRSLIKGICLYNSNGKRRVVDKEDYDTLIQFVKFINFNFTEI